MLIHELARVVANPSVTDFELRVRFTDGGVPSDTMENGFCGKVFTFSGNLKCIFFKSGPNVWIVLVVYFKVFFGVFAVWFHLNFSHCVRHHISDGAVIITKEYRRLND